MRLDGKVALVTGAAQGFGWGIARALGQAGARVCATDVNTEELAYSHQGYEDDGSEFLLRRLDAGNPEDFNQVVHEVVDRWGRLDVLVHAGVVMPLVKFEYTSLQSARRQLDICLGGIIYGTRAVWDVMKNQGGGHIIGIASGSSFRGYVDEVIYCAGKHGVEGFVKALAFEASPYNIALNTIGPGKPIKPTGVGQSEVDRMSDEETAGWTNPIDLGKAFVWLANQPPSRYTGLRFDAGPIIDTIAAEGWDFEFTPEKVTPYADDVLARFHWQANYGKE